MTEPEPPSDPREAMPARTTPTWEMELLVSGATVFGLLQLPDLSDRWLFGLYNTAPMAVAGMVMPLWIYVTFALYVLIATFIAHLCLRGYWVALVGLTSVYPQGIRWQAVREKAGPHIFAETQRKYGDLSAVIEAADNRASKVFGVGFGTASLMLIPILLVLVMMAVLWACERLFGGGINLLLVALVVFTGLTTPYAAFVFWDRKRGAKVPDASRESRFMRAALRFYHGLAMDRSSNLPLVLYSSNEGTRRAGMLLFVSMTVTFGIAFFLAVGERYGWSMADYSGLPNDALNAEDVVLPRHYASQRGTDPRLVPSPVIPDPVVHGDYLRLFVPYFPQRDSLAMAIRCPEALAAGATARTRLDCLAKLHPIAIDGVPVAVAFDAAEDPLTGQRGMLAMIPVKALADGRHVLTVDQASRRRDDDKGERPPPWRIPFWR